MIYTRKDTEMINLTKEQQEQYDKIIEKVSSDKDKQVLGDHVVNLSKCMVDLSSKSKVDLCGQIARVVVALDYSGSMNTLYNNGVIQRTLCRLVPLGLSFDDNGELEVYLFESGFKRFPVLTLQNYFDYVNSIINTSGYHMGGTCYAPVLNAILHDTHKLQTKAVSNKGGFFANLFGGSKSTEVVPVSEGDSVFVIFITDGENNDKSLTDDIIITSAKTNTFIQFIGIGNKKFDYLRKLDDLPGRVIDNTGFSNLQDLNNITDTDLYNMLLEQFVEWLKNKN